MRHKWMITLLTLLLLLSCIPPAYADGEVQQLISVGLFYGKDALDGANLKNDVGTGYRFGFYDPDRTFHQLGYTDVTDLSVVKAQNVYFGTYDGYTSYFDHLNSNIVVGCWHVQLPQLPASFEEAQSIAQGVGGFPAWINGAYQVRFGAFVTREEAESAAQLMGGTVAGTSAYAVSVVQTGTATILFQFDGGAERSLAVAPGRNHTQPATTWFKGYRYFGDFQYQRVNGGDLVISNILPLETYVNCVISREMSSSWPLEALKAQAVCARTYYQINLGRHSAHGFDICCTTHCQAYYGMDAANENTARAAAETAGKKVWYNGKPAQTYYFSCGGGGTENVRNVWPGKDQIPYLSGVNDPYEALVADKIKGYNWTVTFTGQELANILQSKGYACSEIVDIQVEHTPTGNVKVLTFIDSNGKTWPFSKEASVRNMLNLKSMHYHVERSGHGAASPSVTTSSKDLYVSGGGKLPGLDQLYAIDRSGGAGKVDPKAHAVTAAGTQPLTQEVIAPSVQTGDFVFVGAGWGHNVGMSQWGAHAMALQGMTYDQIITFYYPGVEIY